MKLTPAEIWAEYQEAAAFNQEVNLYDTVKRNEKFYIGEQWYGADVPKGMDKPVFNILKRVVAYFISTIVSDDIAAQVEAFQAGNRYDEFLKIVGDEISRVIENTKFKSKNREILRSAAVDGDAYLYFRMDTTPQDSGHDTPGEIAAEVLDNINVLFGNPQVCDIQGQPFIILVLRKTLSSVRREARAEGVPEDVIDLIREDDTEYSLSDTSEKGKVTELVKLYRADSGTIHAVKVTQTVTIKPDTDLGYRLYPLAGMVWDKIKGNYHGQAAVTGLLPNQIFINKLFAMSMEHVKNMAFPKVIYNKVMISQWSNAVGASIAVDGDPNQAIASGFRAPDMSNQVMSLIEKVIQYTRDTMGASDAALGNIRPDNTSAIIAVQKSSAMPLELQRMDFFQFVEDSVRIILDIIREDYGVREVSGEDGSPLYVDFSALNQLRWKLNVEVGASTYWSELMQVQTMDNLFSRGIITDAVTYLESIPDEYIHGKQKLLESLKQKQAEADSRILLSQIISEYESSGSISPDTISAAAGMLQEGQNEMPAMQN